MSFALARGLVAHLISFAVFLQGVELLKMVHQGAVLKIWSRENLEDELKANLPLPPEWVTYFADDAMLTYLAYGLMGFGAIAFVHPSALVFFIVALVQILACVRFRGSINGGSDSMTAMVLIGIWISYLFKKESFACAGLIWISVNLLISYGRAGLAKLKQPEWKDGSALTSFLSQSFYEDVRNLSANISPETAKKLSWGVIVFEFALVFSPLLADSSLSLVFFVAVIFHFANYWAFGLNRFFWAWIAAWPAIFYLSEVINHPAIQ